MKLIQKSAFVLVALLSSGCLQYIMVMGTDRQQADATRKVLGESVKTAREKKDCEAWISGLNAAREKLPVMNVGGKGTSHYGTQVDDAYEDCLHAGLFAFERSEGSEPEHERLTRLVARIDLVLSLPLEQQMGHGRKDTKTPIPAKEELPALRAKLTARLSELDRVAAEALARQTRRIDAATLAEGKGWPVAALAAWLAVAPVDKAMKTRRDEAVARLGPLARAQVAVPVALVPAATGGASATMVAQVRSAAAISSRPTVRLVDTPSTATVKVQLGVGAFTTDRAQELVSFEHRYVSATKEVPNPRLETLKKDLAYHDKEAAYWRRKITEIRCTGSGPCKPRISAQDNARREEEKAAHDRRDLAQEKPTVRSDVVSVYPYSGQKTVVTVSAPLSITLESQLATAPAQVTGVAKVQRAAITSTANSKVGLAGRSDPVPTPAELDAALTSECARLLAEAVLAAPALAASEFDPQAAAATEPLEKLQYALVRAARSGKAADVEAAGALETSLLETKADPAALLRALMVPSEGSALRQR